MRPPLVGHHDLNTALEAGFSTEEVAYMFDLDADPVAEGDAHPAEADPTAGSAVRVDTRLPRAYKPIVA